MPRARPGDDCDISFAKLGGEGAGNFAAHGGSIPGTDDRNGGFFKQRRMPAQINDRWRVGDCRQHWWIVRLTECDQPRIDLVSAV